MTTINIDNQVESFRIENSGYTFPEGKIIKLEITISPRNMDSTQNIRVDFGEEFDYAIRQELQDLNLPFKTEMIVNTNDINSIFSGNAETVVMGSITIIGDAQ